MCTYCRLPGLNNMCGRNICTVYGLVLGGAVTIVAASRHSHVMELGITSSLLVETRIVEIIFLLLRNVHTICFRSRFIIDSQETSVAAVRCSPAGICGCSTSVRLVLGCTDPRPHGLCDHIAEFATEFGSPIFYPSRVTHRTGPSVPVMTGCVWTLSRVDQRYRTHDAFVSTCFTIQH